MFREYQSFMLKMWKKPYIYWKQPKKIVKLEKLLWIFFHLEVTRSFRYKYGNLEIRLGITFRRLFYSPSCLSKDWESKNAHLSMIMKRNLLLSSNCVSVLNKTKINIDNLWYWLFALLSAWVGTVYIDVNHCYFILLLLFHDLLVSSITL